MEPLPLFIICCLLSLVAAVLYTFVSVAIYKTEQANKNPFYFCDGDYICCAAGNTACDNTSKGITKIDNTYFPSDRYSYGSAYYQYCVLPIQNAILNYNNKNTTNFDFNYLYSSTVNPGNTGPPGNPSVYYPGCSGPGSSYPTGDTGVKPECLDTKLNPWLPVYQGSCPFVSYDTPNLPAQYQSNPKQPLNTQGGNKSVGVTIPVNNWQNASNSNYIANLGGNNFSCPYQGITNQNVPTTGLSGSNLLG